MNTRLSGRFLFLHTQKNTQSISANRHPTPEIHVGPSPVPLQLVLHAIKIKLLLISVKDTIYFALIGAPLRE
jgi:hypothetical protein